MQETGSSAADLPPDKLTVQKQTDADDAAAVELIQQEQAAAAKAVARKAKKLKQNVNK